MEFDALAVDGLDELIGVSENALTDAVSVSVKTEVEAVVVRESSIIANTLPDITGGDTVEVINTKVNGSPLATSLWTIAKDVGKFVATNAAAASVFFVVTLVLTKTAGKAATDSGGSSRKSFSSYIESGINALKTTKPIQLVDANTTPADLKKLETQLLNAAMLIPAIVDLTT